MNYPLYCIRDLKASFQEPFLSANDQAAKRDFILRLATSNVLTRTAPSDFDLYFIGHFDTETGLLTSEAVARYLYSGSAVVDDVHSLASEVIGHAK